MTKPRMGPTSQQVNIPKTVNLCFVGQAANRHEMPVGLLGGACPGRDEFLLIRNVLPEKRGTRGQQAGRGGPRPYRSRTVAPDYAITSAASTGFSTQRPCSLIRSTKRSTASASGIL